MNTNQEYLDFISSHDHIYSSGYYNTREFSIFIDEISKFWLERLPNIDNQLRQTNADSQIMLLSGVIYLGTKTKEHFYLKSFGDYHIFPDPLMKVEPFIRGTSTPKLSPHISKLVTDAIYDTKYALEQFGDVISVLPIRLLAQYRVEKFDTHISDFVWVIISSIFKSDFSSNEEFTNHFESLAAIERAIPSHLRPHFIFSENDTRADSLETKMNNYSQYLDDLSPIPNSPNGPDLFVIALRSQLSQIIEIILSTSSLDAWFLVRAHNTFGWLIVLKAALSANEEYANMIDQAITFYLFRYAIKSSDFEGLSLAKYSRVIRSSGISKQIFESAKLILSQNDNNPFRKISDDIKVSFESFLELNKPDLVA